MTAGFSQHRFLASIKAAYATGGLSISEAIAGIAGVLYTDPASSRSKWVTSASRRKRADSSGGVGLM
jgi:hypothetical protein